MNLLLSKYFSTSQKKFGQLVKFSRGDRNLSTIDENILIDLEIFFTTREKIGELENIFHKKYITSNKS